MSNVTMFACIWGGEGDHPKHNKLTHL